MGVATFLARFRNASIFTLTFAKLASNGEINMNKLLRLLFNITKRSSSPSTETKVILRRGLLSN